MENLIHELEKNSNQYNQRLQLLDPYLTPALNNMSDITSFIVKNDLSVKYESIDTQTTLKLMLSTFSQHLHAYLSHPNPKNLDWSRFRTILENIANFRKEQGAFSLYKIYRSVREKYSLEEYINCN